MNTTNNIYWISEWQLLNDIRKAVKLLKNKDFKDLKINNYANKECKFIPKNYISNK